MIVPGNFRYTAYYCEENAWHLCNDRASPNCWVVFVSNPDRQVPMWFQKAAVPGAPVLWDYHVFCIAKDDMGWQVLDLDSTLGLPVPVGHYLSSSFPGKIRIRYSPRFRVISGVEYLDQFSSDRSHMHLPPGGFPQPPPVWPMIHTPGINNLERFIDMEKGFLGEVYSLSEFREKLS